MTADVTKSPMTMRVLEGLSWGARLARKGPVWLRRAQWGRDVGSGWQGRSASELRTPESRPARELPNRQALTGRRV